MLKFSLRVKLMLVFFLVIAIPLMTLGYLSYSMSAKALQATIEQQLLETTANTAEIMEITVEAATKVLATASDNQALIEAAGSGEQESRMEAFQYLAKLKQGNGALLETLVLVDRNGKGILTHETHNADLDLSERQYVRQALQGKVGTSDVITSKASGESVIGIALPLHQGNGIVGVLVGSVRFDQITKHAAEIKIGKSGYAYMVNKEGLVLYHPNKDNILKLDVGEIDNKELKVLTEKMKAGESGSGFYTYEGIYKYVCFKPVGDWVLVLTANYDEYMEAALRIQRGTAMICILAILIAMVFAYLISSYNIIYPIMKLRDLMTKAGKGDLTVHAEIKTRDEIHDLAESFNQMIQEQSKIVGQVRSGAQELAASSEEMAASSEQVNATTQTISHSIQEVAKDTDRQNQSVVEISQVLVQLSSLVQLAQNKAAATHENAEHTMKTAQYGRNKVNETVEAMEVIERSSQDTASVLQVLKDLSTRIGSIINTINQIAEQTNLLALNAAIEAARAGEHGRGFAVVAEEVRKLSDQSNRGASEITNMVKEMIDQTKIAVDSMNYGKQAVGNGVKIVKETDAAFLGIINAVEGIVKNVVEIVDITKDEVATSDQVVKLIDTVATITETTSANSEEVAAATEEQTAAVETLAATAEEASAMANALDELVHKFKIRGEENGQFEK